MPLIGFAGSPFTLACYMIEGGGSDDFARVRRMLYARPDLLQRVLDDQCARGDRIPRRADRAGADAVMMFDTWGGLLAHDAYEAFSLASIRAVLKPLRDRECRVADHRVHQGRRPVARRHRGVRLRARGARLDDGPRGRAAAALARASRCRAISIRWCC